MSEYLLELENLSIGYHKNKVLVKDLNLKIEAGEFICLLGPNGAGKSTLLKTCLGLMPSLDGQVKLLGKDFTSYNPIERARTVSAMLTDRVKTDHLKVIDLVLLGRFPYRKGFQKLSDSDYQIAKAALQCVNAAAFSERNIDSLSDGERQRVFIARSLTQDPQLLFLDEPTSFLDYPHRVETFHLMRQWAHHKQRSVLMTSHDIDLSLCFADRIILLNERGRVYEGAPEDLILDGTFHDIFHSKHLHVDEDEGRFEVTMDTDKKIHFYGSGREFAWTVRALNRAGFEVDKNSELKCELKNGSWTLTDNKTSITFKNIAQLINNLRYLRCN